MQGENERLKVISRQKDQAIADIQKVNTGHLTSEYKTAHIDAVVRAYHRELHLNFYYNCLRLIALNGVTDPSECCNAIFLICVIGI